MNLPDNWDKAESAYNKHYDPYDDEDGSMSQLVHCPNCDAYIDLDDRIICDTHDFHYCEWCANDSKGGHEDGCQTRKGDKIEIPF